MHRSNATAPLADALCRVLAEPCDDPIAEDVVLIPSNGMEAWLEQRIADTLGVCANVRFPFPLKELPRLIAAAAATGTTRPARRRDFEAILRCAARWAPASLAWPLWAALDRRRDDEAFQPVRTYLSGATDESSEAVRRWKFAMRLARAFDRYLRFRPDWIRDWQRDPAPDNWQALLWNDVRHHVARREGRPIEAPQHPVDLSDAARFRLVLGAPSTELLPERLFVFGVSTLPPFYLELLGALANFIDVHVFVVTPSRGYFADLVPDDVKVRAHHEAFEEALVQGRAEDLDLSALHFDDSPPLLASLGTLGAEFQRLLADIDGEVVEHEHWHEMDGADALRTLQRDVLDLRVPAEPPPSDLSEGWNTIEVHRTHNDMRQVQALHDRLLALLGPAGPHPGLCPHDVVVMSPDLDAFAPLIDAVFDLPLDDPRRIPYRLADRSERQANPVAEALLRWLALAGTRLERSATFDLLALEPVRIAFGFSADEVADAEEILASAGVRWGLDAAHRAREGHPEDERGSWRWGLDRLLLGSALADEPPRLVAGLRPVGAAEGKAAEALGRLRRFVDTLAALDAATQATLAPKEWRAFVHEMLETCLGAAHEDAWRIQRTRERIDAAFDAWDDASAAGQRAPFALVRLLLEETLSEPRLAHGFLRGGVTFCDMLPMRSVPFRVVCLLGMDDGRFPRQDTRTGFDLLESSRRAGDRSRRADDRYLLLEALLAAQERLIIVHQGFQAQSAKEVPPSPLVDELLEAIVARFGPDAADATIVTHRLHPFDPRAFAPDSPAPSYAVDGLAGARALSEPSSAPPPFWDATLPELEAETLALRHVVGALRTPQRTLLGVRLGLSFHTAWDLPSEDDPVVLDSLQRWSLRDDLLRLFEAGAADPLQLIEARNTMPLGALAINERKELGALLAHVREACTEHGVAPHARSVDVELAAHNSSDRVVRVVGPIHGLRSEALVRFTASKLSDRDRVAHWVRFVAASCAGVATSALLVAPDGVVRFERPSDPDDAWRAIVDMAWALLSDAIPYAPQIMAKLDDPPAKLRKAWDKLAKHDPALVRLFPSGFPLERRDEVRALAAPVWSAMCACERSERGAR